MKIPNWEDLASNVLMLLSLGMVISGAIILIGLLSPFIVLMACMIIAVIVAMTLRENAENDNPWRLIMVCMGGMITGGIGEIYPNLIDIITVLFLIILTFGSIVIIAAGKNKMVES